MFSIRVEENATEEVESATGTSRFAPVPFFGSMILYGTSYLCKRQTTRKALSPSLLCSSATAMQRMSCSLCPAHQFDEPTLTEARRHAAAVLNCVPISRKARAFQKTVSSLNAAYFPVMC